MFRVTKATRDEGLPSHAGKYVVLDVGGFTFQEWLLLNMKHVVDFTRPNSHLPPRSCSSSSIRSSTTSASPGHYQVGRG